MSDRRRSQLDGRPDPAVQIQTQAGTEIAHGLPPCPRDSVAGAFVSGTCPQCGAGGGCHFMTCPRVGGPVSFSFDGLFNHEETDVVDKNTQGGDDDAQPRLGRDRVCDRSGDGDVPDAQLRTMNRSHMAYYVGAARLELLLALMDAALASTDGDVRVAAEAIILDLTPEGRLAPVVRIKNNAELRAPRDSPSQQAKLVSVEDGVALAPGVRLKPGAGGVDIDLPTGPEPDLRNSAEKARDGDGVGLFYSDEHGMGYRAEIHGRVIWLAERKDG
jgi:hypothetical protein